MKKYKYNIEEYDFASEVGKICGASPTELDSLHELRKDLMPSDALTFETETRTDFHETFYKVLNSIPRIRLKNTYIQHHQKILSYY